MISKTNFNVNYSSMFIWLALALAATANLGLFILLIMYFFKQREILIPKPQQTPQNPPPTKILNETIEDRPNHLPQQVLQQLQNMISQRQLVNINHNLVALC
jgi:hypothetical protein